MVYPLADNQYPEQRQFTYKGGEIEIANSTKRFLLLQIHKSSSEESRCT